MTGKLRRRTAASCMVLSCLIALAFAASLFWFVGILTYTSPQSGVCVDHGSFGFCYVDAYPRRPAWTSVSPVDGTSRATDLRAVVRSARGRDPMRFLPKCHAWEPRSRSLYIPLWMPFLLTATLWLCLRRKRHERGHCERCGYDLTGNTSGVCPECGSTVASNDDRSHQHLAE